MIGTCDKGGFATPIAHKNDHPDIRFRWPLLPVGLTTFNPLHTALIVKGPFRGFVLAWQYNVPPCTNQRGIPSGLICWSIIDPEKAQNDPTREMNFVRNFAPAAGDPNDIACSGHMWLPNGTLWVVGGTEEYAGLACPNNPLAQVVGAKLCYIFDPSVPVLTGYPTLAPGHAMWSQSGIQSIRRWYPTGTLGSHVVQPHGSRLSFGGHLELNPPHVGDTYEVWDQPSGAWRQRVFEGPTGVHSAASVSALFAYPRMHLLSNAYVFMSGMYSDRVTLAPLPAYRSAALNPPYDPPGTTLPDWKLRGFDTEARIYGTSVLHPQVSPLYQDVVVALGGMTSSGVVRDDVAQCKASAVNQTPWPVGHNWLDLPPMNYARVFLNAVVMPDATVVVVGGSSDAAMANPVLQAERYRGGAWELLASMQVPRVYHSTALLLPKGTVLLAGGEEAGSVLPFETFHPPYLFCGPRPQWIAPFPNEELAHGESFDAWATVPVGAVIAKVVLMRAGSSTHHFDQDQRYIEMLPDQSSEGTYVTCTVPLNKDEAPPGYYMGFLVTNQGLPSEARWFRLKP